VAEQIHLLVDRPFRDRLAAFHAVLEQRAPELEIAGGEIAIGKRDAHQDPVRRGGALAFGRGEGGIQPHQRSRADAQDQFIDVLDQIVDRAVGNADVARQIARLQAGQSLGSDALFGRQDQGIPKFRSSFQSFRHPSPFLSNAQNNS
jgi:hypothetical protein